METIYKSSFIPFSCRSITIVTDASANNITDTGKIGARWKPSAYFSLTNL